jgi:hypothetical protein
MRDDWNELKEYISNALKFILLITVMTIGFWAIYAMVWMAIGLPEPSWYMWALFGLAVLTEYNYVCWLNE